VIQDTGIKKLDIQSPDVKNLGYVSVSFKAEVGSGFTKSLLGKNQLENLARIQFSTNTLISAHLANGINDDVCISEENVESCKSRISNESRNALDKIKLLANDLKAQHGVNQKQYSQTLAKIGEQAWTNQFVFKAILEQMKNCGSIVTYEVSGARISDHQIQEVNTFNEKTCKL
jgi:hypothetical protein